MQYNTIFFDIGNTLFFFNYAFLCDLLAQKFGISVAKEELELSHVAMKRSLISGGCLNMPHDELWMEAYRRWFASIGVSDDVMREVIEAVKTHPFKHLFWSRMEEGAPRMLSWFRERGYRTGVISNAEGQIKRIVENAGLLDHFDVVIDSGVVGVAKPNARIFEIAMKEMNAVPSRSIHVGDLFDIDVVGSRSAGMTPILVDPDGSHTGIDCLVVKRVTDLPSLSIFSEGA